MKIQKDNPYIHDGDNAYVYEHGYADGRKETAQDILRELWFGSVFTYTNINGCAEQCENLIRQFDNVVKEVAKEYGVELDNE